MSDILRATQPINPGFESNTITNNPIVSSDTKIQNIVDPSKVVRADAKTESEDSRFIFQPGSNFEGFIKQLKNTPQLYELFTKIMFLDSQTLISSGLNEGFAEKLAQFMEMLKMDQGQLIQFMNKQTSDSTGFHNVFFQALKEVFDQTRSVDLKSEILQFAKLYNSFASSPHLLRTIQTQAKAMLPYMMTADADKLKELLAHLDIPETANFEQTSNQLFEFLDQNIQKNSQVLQNELLPFFSSYIGKTHDMGKIRQLISLFTHNVSSYVNGSGKELIKNFKFLLGFSEFNQRFQGLGEENVKLILEKLLSQKQTGEAKTWSDALLDIIQSGMNNYENKAVFTNMMNALLLNESVYMPFIHLMLPVELNGQTMFSELWIDPDAENESDGSSNQDSRGIRMMIKFDIKDLGLFDVIMNYREGQVDLQVYYPEKLSSAEKEIRSAMSDIIKANGLSTHSLTLDTNRKPHELMEVFPKILEGRNSINVRV